MEDNFYDAEHEALVKDLQLGEEKAFALLYDLLGGKIYGLSRKFGLSHEDAEGIVQEVFIKLWNRKASLDPRLSLKAYVFKVSKSIIIRKKKRVLIELAYKNLESLNGNQRVNDEIENQLIFKDLMDLVLKWVSKLPKGQKQVYELKNIHHLSIDEIAEKLKVPKRRVENQICRANKTLRDKLMEGKFLVMTLGLFLSNL